MLDGKFATCPVCRKPYKLYSMVARDQSVCRECEQAAAAACDRPSTPAEEARRRAAFGGLTPTRS